jgi:hypothetical protein
VTGRQNRSGRPDLAKFPVNFPVSREFGTETGSQLTASSARQCAEKKRIFVMAITS